MEAINTEDLNKARKQIDELSKLGKPAIVYGKDIEFNRKILEMKHVNMLIIEHKNKKDKLKQRDSGLNQVLCKLAKEKNIVLALDFSEAISTDGTEKAKILSRIIQNIKLIKKYKNEFKITAKSSRSDYDLRAFLQVLGLPTDMSKKAVE